MSSAPLPDQYRIFKAYGKVFSGEKARLRKMRSIRAEVQNAELEASYQALVNDYGIEKIVSTLRSLLQQGVFGSDSKAQNLFSELRCTHQVDDALPISARDDVMLNGLITLDHKTPEHPILPDQPLVTNHSSCSCHGKQFFMTYDRRES